jgi:hypothetical protein
MDLFSNYKKTFLNYAKKQVFGAIKLFLSDLSGFKNLTGLMT